MSTRLADADGADARDVEFEAVPGCGTPFGLLTPKFAPLDPRRRNTASRSPSGCWPAVT
jgi:hypothetical protein